MHKYLLITAIIASCFIARAQYCIPTTTNYCCGFGITNVTFSGINNNSSNASVGYEDFTSISTTLVQGNSYPVSVKVNQPSEHNVRIWIDFNNDKVFDNVNELVFSADQVFMATGGILIPANALLNTNLRMRISADYYQNAVPGPCSNLQVGQAEDYTIVVQQNTSKPAPDFTSDVSVTCTGIVSFSDLSSNIPTSWLWSFGDGNTSTLQNPVHNYASSGNYTVTLKASNQFGTDSVSKTNYISVNLLGSLTAPSCSPVTTAHCCKYGIYKVVFNGINNTTSGGNDSYKDYSCTQTATVTEGNSYNIQVQTGPDNPEDIKVWIDLNNDGNLNNTNELVFTSNNSKIHNGSILIPSGAVKDTMLRMRIMSDLTGNSNNSCTNPQWGQVEDYGIKILSSTQMPTAAFTANATMSCGGTVSFTDNSTGIPTAWLWNFGDGNTSNLQNPTHTYSNAGTYTVSLTATNQFGSNTSTKNNYIFVAFPAATAQCSPITFSYCCGMGITNVTFNTINNTTPDGVDNYKDYSCQKQTTVGVSKSYNITIQTGDNYSENVRVWIDFNNNGTFNNSSELVFESLGQFTFHSGNINIPANAVLNTPLRMRIASDLDSEPVPDYCNNVRYGQVEDYAIIVQNATAAPVADFTADSTLVCLGNVKFTDLSANTPSSWLWDFGDGTTSNVKNPSHQYTSNGNFTVKLTATNPAGSNTKIKSNYITVNNTLCGGNAISENSETENLFTFYPNPARDYIVINYLQENHSNNSLQLELINITGQIVLKNSTAINNKTEISISGLAKGLYFLKISDGDITEVKKIILE
jgi:PKD repeat protein